MNGHSIVDGPHGGGYFERSVPSVKTGQKIVKNAEELQTVLVEIEVAFSLDL